MSLVSVHFNPVSSAQLSTSHHHHLLAHSKNPLTLPPFLPHSAPHFQFCLLAKLPHIAPRVALLKHKSGNVISLLRNHQWLSNGLKTQCFPTVLGPGISILLPLMETFKGPYEDLQGSSPCPLSSLTIWHSPWSLSSNHLRPAQP